MTSSWDVRTALGLSLAGDVLEIGPGHVPFPVAAGVRVTYADRSIEGGRDANFPELIGEPQVRTPTSTSTGMGCGRSRTRRSAASWRAT